MIVISIITELLLLLFVILMQQRHKNTLETGEESFLFRLLLPAGKAISEWVPYTERRMQRHHIYAALCQLTDEVQAKRLYLRYQYKRWSLLLAVLMLCNGMGIGLQLRQYGESESLSPVQERPSYGEGDENEEVILVLEGADGKIKDNISLHIPQKSITEEEAAERLQQGMKYIQKQLQDQMVKQSLTLPAQWQGVSFFYESLTPTIFKEDGRMMGGFTAERQKIILNVTGSIAGQRQTTEICMWVPALSELSAEERLKMISQKVQMGDYIQDDVVRLPTKTELGETLYWMRQTNTNAAMLGGFFLLLIVLIFWQQDQEYKHKVKQQQDQMKHAYPEMMNELVILLGAGLSLPAAWKRMGDDYQKQCVKGKEMNPLYEEIYRESKQLEAGSSMREVLEEFTLKIRFKEARRFAVLMVQNLKRGDAFLIARLRELNREAWELRKKQVRERSEEVDTKLLIPLMLMLIVILIIVLTPAMISMQV